MQVVDFTGVALAWLTVALPTANLNVPEELKINTSRVEVRCGPSMRNYPTSVGKQGDRLLPLYAVAVPSGWLAIKPPQNSFSWIKSAEIERAANGKTARVVVDLAPVLVGSSIVKEKPDVAQGALERGAVVEIVGREMQTVDGSWTPIKSPSYEVRYIPTSAVEGLRADKGRPTVAGRTPSVQQELRPSSKSQRIGAQIEPDRRKEEGPIAAEQVAAADRAAILVFRDATALSAARLLSLVVRRRGDAGRDGHP